MATNPMTMEQFGQTIKAKHPEYSDMEDGEVASRVLAKYPQYGNMVGGVAPAAPLPAGLRGPETAQDKAAANTPKFGSSVSDVLSTVGNHLSGMATGPYHTFADPPQDATEKKIAGPQNGIAGQFMLGGYRALVKPTVQAIQQGNQQRKAGDTLGAVNSYEDAVPLAGPWARNIENDISSKGAVAGLAGMATDAIAPKVAAKGLGLATRTTGQGMQIASATPETQQLGLTRAVAPGAPEDMLMRGLKPNVSYPNAKELFKSTLPDIVGAGGKIGNVSDFSDAAKRAAEQKNSLYQGWLQPNKSLPVDTSPLVAAQKASTPTLTSIESPDTVESLYGKADSYAPGKGFNLGQVDDIRRGSNQTLHSYLSQNPADRYAAQANPETARMNALNNSSRDLTYSTLSKAADVPEETIRKTQNLYGDLRDVSDIAGKRNIVASRANPMSLPETIAASHGGVVSKALDFATERLLKNATDSDALTRSAVDRYQHPEGTPFQPKNMWAVAPFMAGKGLEGGGQLMMNAARNPLANPLFYSAVNPPKKK